MNVFCLVDACTCDCLLDFGFFGAQVRGNSCTSAFQFIFRLVENLSRVTCLDCLQIRKTSCAIYKM